MAVKKKTVQTSNRNLYFIFLIITITLLVYLWFLYDRLFKQQQINTQTNWSLFSLITSNKEEETLKMTLFIEMIQKDLNLVYLTLVQIICLFIPRETTSIISGVVLILTVIFTYWFINNKKDVKKQKAITKLENNVDVECSDPKNWPYCRWNYPNISWMMLLLVLSAFLISIPWEYVRLFQIEVAKRMAVMEKGVPKECYPDKMTISQSIRYWLLMQLSWQHDPCEKYHKALLVDPLWEITPLMVVSSVVTRSLLHPVELFFSGIGKSFKLFFNEIPAQWQPVMLITMTIIVILTAVMVCGYKITLPLLIKIEPKSPVFDKLRSYMDRDCCADSKKVQNVERKKLDYPQDNDQ